MVPKTSPSTVVLPFATDTSLQAMVGPIGGFVVV